MLYEITKLQKSNNEIVREIGRFFYDKDLNNGLSKHEVELLIELISGIDKEIEDSYDKGYYDGEMVIK